jgi:DNA-binding response OmpR family regulator
LGVGRNVLFIDDDVLVGQWVRDLLEREGFHVTIALNGRDGLAAARRHPPDLILLDVVLPGMDGFDVCREIRQDSELSTVSVVMLTATKSPKLNANAFAAGAEACVTKPFQPHRLVNTVHMTLQNAALKKGRLRPKNGA